MVPLVKPPVEPSSAKAYAQPISAPMLRIVTPAVLGVTVQGGELAATGPAFAQSPDQAGWYGQMHDGWGHMMGWGGTMFGGIGMLLFWGVIIVLLVLFARGYTGGARTRATFQSPHSGSTALDILQERYAKGEINKEEYEQRKKTLTE
jgi:putative membrane protein